MGASAEFLFGVAHYFDDHVQVEIGALAQTTETTRDILFQLVASALLQSGDGSEVAARCHPDFQPCGHHSPPLAAVCRRPAFDLLRSSAFFDEEVSGQVIVFVVQTGEEASNLRDRTLRQEEGSRVRRQRRRPLFASVNCWTTAWISFRSPGASTRGPISPRGMQGSQRTTLERALHVRTSDCCMYQVGSKSACGSLV